MPHDPANWLLATYPNEWKTYIQTKIRIWMLISSIIHTSQKVEIIQMSIRWWVDKQNEVYHIVGNEKEWIDTRYTWIRLENIKLSGKNSHKIILYDSIHVKCPEQTNPETDSGLVVARGWMGWEWEVTKNGYKVSFQRWWKYFEIVVTMAQFC